MPTEAYVLGDPFRTRIHRQQHICLQGRIHFQFVSSTQHQLNRIHFYTEGKANQRAATCTDKSPWWVSKRPTDNQEQRFSGDQVVADGCSHQLQYQNRARRESIISVKIDPGYFDKVSTPWVVELYLLLESKTNPINESCGRRRRGGRGVPGCASLAPRQQWSSTSAHLGVFYRFGQIERRLMMESALQGAWLPGCCWGIASSSSGHWWRMLVGGRRHAISTASITPVRNPGRNSPRIATRLFHHETYMFCVVLRSRSDKHVR